MSDDNTYVNFDMDSYTVDQSPTESPVESPTGSKDFDFNVLRTAMKVMDSDEDAIIEILSELNLSEREQLVEVMKTETGRDLLKDLKDGLGGKFEDLILPLMQKPAEFLACELFGALKEVEKRINLELVVEVLCTRSGAEIQEIAAAYKNKFGDDLECSVTRELSEQLKTLFSMIFNITRKDAAQVNMELARENAEAVCNAGKDGLISLMICGESFPQLHATFEEYQKICGRTVEQSIKLGFSGDVEKTLRTIAQCAINRNRFFAEKLEKALKETDYATLIRIIVSERETHLDGIKGEYEAAYGKSMYNSVNDGTSGDYKKALLALIGSY